MPGESYGRRILVGYSPQGRKKSDTTERLHFHFHYEREAYGSVSEFINGRIKLLNCRKGKMSVCAKSLQLCSPLCNPTDCSPPGSSVHGILQARTLEWVAMPSSRGSSRPRDQTCNSCSSYTAGEFFTTETQGKPILKKREQQKYKNRGEFSHKVLKSSLMEQESGRDTAMRFHSKAYGLNA